MKSKILWFYLILKESKRIFFLEIVTISRGKTFFYAQSPEGI